MRRAQKKKAIRGYQFLIDGKVYDYDDDEYGGPVYSWGDLRKS